MSDYLSKLPLEISNQIYRDLLVDTTDPIELQGTVLGAGHLKKKLHTNILRASKAVYAQASTVLYGCNLFSFQYPKICVKRGGTNLFSKERRPQNGAFGNIKHVEIVFRPRDNNHICQNAEEIMAVVNHVKDRRCSLKTLCLAFTFQEARTYPLIVFYDEPKPEDSALSAARTIASCAVLIDAVSSLKVENKIEIVITGGDENCLVVFEDFAAQIGSQKQWATTLQREIGNTKGKEECSEEEEVDADFESDAIESSSDEEDHEDGRYCTCDSCESGCSDSCESGCSDSCESVGSEPEPRRHIWTWTLTPATEGTDKSIPETDRS